MENEKQGQADPQLALQYMGEVAKAYADTLNPVEKAPFVNQVNLCLKVIMEDRKKLMEAVERLQAPKESEE